MANRAALFLPLAIWACGRETPASDGDQYDTATLAAYRSAIPDGARLLANVPTAVDTPFGLTSRGDAVLAAHGVEFARAVNRPVRALVATLHTITDLPPTRFDATRRQFAWGPWDNDHGVGQVTLVLTKNDSGADFEYSYALVRTSGEREDGGDPTPVISGGATPNPDDSDRGVGVALWDIEANRAFDLEHASEQVAEADGRGRFVTLFGHESSDAGEAFFNVALFRSFVPERDAAGTASREPVDIDYFYGRLIDDAGARIDFVDSEVFADLCTASVETCFASDVGNGRAERFSYSAFFVNHGLGRAEARLSEGDLDASTRFVECWDPGLDRTSFKIENAGAMLETVENGSCTAPADQSAPELGLPTLGDIDPALLAAMSFAAESGLIGRE